eukprot:4476309-Prymnesium_polylepis.1
MLDIPVHGEKLTESLHVLFTLFSEFKANIHFQQQLANAPPPPPPEPSLDMQLDEGEDVAELS